MVSRVQQPRVVSADGGNDRASVLLSAGVMPVSLVMLLTSK